MTSAYVYLGILILILLVAAGSWTLLVWAINAAEKATAKAEEEEGWLP